MLGYSVLSVNEGAGDRCAHEARVAEQVSPRPGPGIIRRSRQDFSLPFPNLTSRTILQHKSAGMVNAVILGGSGVDERLEGTYDYASKGLIPLRGKACVEYVLEAARATPEIDRIALAGPPPLLEHPSARLADVSLPQQGTIVEKLVAAAGALGHDRKLLMLSCDIPLITAEVLTDAVTRCPEDCAFFHPLVAREAAVRDFPDHQWTFLKLRDGHVVTSNILIMDPQWLTRRPDLAHTIEDLRRHPVRLALRWGLGFLVKLKLGLLSLDYCEGLFSRVLTAPCRGLICSHSELAMDLDRPEDVPMLEQWLGSERS
jgi:GTP:adenosylcobinamide-phosphate guanylyltransferase